MIALSEVVHNAKAMERQLRGELADLGIDWRSLRLTVPDWADVAFNSESGVLELRTFIARSIGLRVGADGRLTVRDLPPACFKTSAATSVEQVNAARVVATACARMIARELEQPYTEFPSSAAALRDEILRTRKRPWIDLKGLLSICWAHGVPAIYLPTLPVTGRKMDGMVTYAAGRPVIVITKKVPHPDWLLFVLAHEIGHLAKGHLAQSEGEAIVDDTVDLAGAGARDVQESEANSFAAHLLAPKGMEVTLNGPLLAAPRLAAVASDYGKANAMAPGYVILNAAHNSKTSGRNLFPLAQAALRLLPSEGSVEEAFRTTLTTHLDPDAFRSDTFEFLEKLGLI